MRILALRRKSRDVRLVGAVLVGVLALTGSRWDDTPAVAGALLACGVLLAGAAAVLRAWASLYIAGHRTERLITEGPFSVCRNPIYLSTLLGLAGVALATRTLGLPLLVLLAFVPYYEVQMRTEERRLLERHGARFEAYRARTPRLVPDLALLHEPLEHAARPAEFRVWLADALWFVWGLGIVDLVGLMHQAHTLPVLWRVY